MSYLDIRNQVANYRLKFSSCNIKKGTCNVLKDNKSKEAISKVLRDLKARNKVRLKYLKGKMTGA